MLGVQMRTVGDLMTTDVRRVHRDTLVCEIAGIFSAARISGAPVVDDMGSTVGFVSNSDVARFDSTGRIRVMQGASSGTVGKNQFSMRCSGSSRDRPKAPVVVPRG